jgi:hypothetical protein
MKTLSSLSHDALSKTRGSEPNLLERGEEAARPARLAIAIADPANQTSSLASRTKAGFNGAVCDFADFRSTRNRVQRQPIP